MLSQHFQTPPIEIEEYNALPVSITYRFKDSDKTNTKDLFSVGSSFPATKSITFEGKNGNCDLLIHYKD